MSVKNDPRRILFAHARFAGRAGVDAAQDAGFKGKRESLKRQAHRLERHPEVIAELERLKGKSEAKAVASRDELRRLLTDQIRSDLGPYMRFDANGAYAGLDLQRLRNDGKAHLLESIEVTDKGTIKVKLESRQGAMDRLAKLEGWNAPEKHQHQGIFDLKTLSDSQLEELAKRVGIDQKRGA